MPEFSFRTALLDGWIYAWLHEYMYPGGVAQGCSSFLPGSPMQRTAIKALHRAIIAQFQGDDRFSSAAEAGFWEGFVQFIIRKTEFKGSVSAIKAPLCDPSDVFVRRALQPSQEEWKDLATDLFGNVKEAVLVTAVTRMRRGFVGAAKGLLQ